MNLPENTDHAAALPSLAPTGGEGQGEGASPAAFQGGHYCSATRSLRIDLGNVAAPEASLIMGLLSLFTDPGHAKNLACLKMGTHLLSLEDSKLALKTPQSICAPGLN